jgi:hypothetical protein
MQKVRDGCHRTTALLLAVDTDFFKQQHYRVSFPAGTTTRQTTSQQLLPTTENPAWILEPLSITRGAYHSIID